MPYRYARFLLCLLPCIAVAQDDCTSPGLFTIATPPAIAGAHIAGIPTGGEWADTTGLLRPGTTGRLVLARDPGDPDIGSEPGQACAPLTNAEQIEGNIALFKRGTCEFSLKARHAQEAGATGWVVYNNDTSGEEDHEVLNMAGGSIGSEVFIPGLFVSRTTGRALLRARRSLLSLNHIEVNLQYASCYYLQRATASVDEVTGSSRELSPPRPNPFAQRTHFDLTLNEAQRVSISVYNLLGQRVAVLYEGALPAQTHTFSFEAGALPKGVYFVRAEGEYFAQTRRIIHTR